MNKETINDKLVEYLNSGYDIDIGGSIGEGWDLFQKYLGGFVGFAALMFIISIAASVIPFGNILVGAPVSVGFYIVANKLTKTTDIEFGSFFDGFNFFGPVVLAALIMTIFIALGFIFLIIPGIYFAVAYMLTYQFIVFGKYEFWDAMEASRKLVSKNWFSFFGLAIILLLINLLGVLALGVGLLFTIPLTYCTLYIVFKKLFDQNVEVTE